MAFTIFGYIDGVAYHVAVADDGTVDGTQNAMEFLDLNEGETTLATPTGPAMLLDRTDPASILCAFNALTQVTSTTGNPPELHEPEQNGVVY